MAFQALAPSTQVFAQELDAAQDAMVAAAFAANDAAQGAKQAVDNLIDSADKGSADTTDATDSDSSPDKDSDAADTSGTAGAGAGNTEETQEPDGDAAANDSESADEAATDEAASDDDATETQAGDDYTYQTLGDLKQVFPSDNITGEGASLVIKVGNNEQLIRLSNANPSVYQHATIEKGNGTGMGLSAAATLSDGLSFRGFGSGSNPFEGTYKFDDVTITANRPLFNNVKWSDKSSAVKVEWTGADSNQPIVATKIDGNGQKLVASVTVNNTVKNTESQDVAAKLTSPLLGQVSGVLTVDAKYATNSSLPLQIDLEGSADNIGLLTSTLADSTSLTVEKFNLPSSYYDDTQTVKTTAAGKSAGALVGDCGNSSTVVLNTSVDFSKLTVVGNEASGGFIGKATNFTLTLGKNSDEKGATVSPALKVGDASTMYAGGVIGDVSFAGDMTIEPDQFKYDNTAVVELGAKKRAGGLFGRLDLTNGDVTIKGGTYRSKLATGDDGNQSDPTTRGSYGGIAGNVCGGDGNTIHALAVAKKDNSSTQIEIERTDNGKLCYVGGVVGYQDGDETAQKTAIVLDGADVTINGKAYAYTGNGKLGGAVGVVDKNQLLEVRDFKLSSANKANKIGESNGGSAGIAGSAWRGIIKFSGTTDLSEAKFADSDLAAQLVYQNYNALIFATGSGSDDGWTFKRPSTEVPIDDICSYGEVIRLGSTGKLSKDLIMVDEDSHKLDLGNIKLSKTDGAYQLRTANDFAKLAITWQTFGYFSMVEDISGGSVKDLASSTINVADTINLAGTGLTGLSKDRSDPGNNEGKADGGDEREDAHYFSGTLTGNGTIELAVGEPYGKRDGATIGADDTSAGNGKIYRHQRLGLFNAVTANAQTSGGVTIDGTMLFENKADIDAGSLTAQVVGTGNVTVSNATFSTAITFDSAKTDKVLNVGGIFGSVAGDCTLTLGTGAKAQARIANTTNTSIESDIRVGEAAGYVADDKTATINVTGLEIGKDSQDDIKTGDCSNGVKALVGGLIGFIQQGSVKKYVTITGLAYKNFSMTVGKNGDAKNGAGGLLGYSWGNSIVTIGGDANNSDDAYALTTNNTSVTADSATEFGGLLYVMSGHLVINNYALNLSDVALSAKIATSFGVLLARGGAGTGFEFGVETAYTGLYLEDKAEWTTAYVVPVDTKISAGAITTPDKTNFDEWVANTTRQGSYTASGEANAVISLHTHGEKLYMGIGEGSDNSYKNRTDVGRKHKTNQNARYYYNLDRCLDAAAPMKDGKHYYDDDNNSTLVSNGRQIWAKSPEALMVWSACRYAPEGLREYIAPDSHFTEASAIFQIGNTEEKKGWTDINLDGYSYYPVDSIGQIIIKNSTITFHYTDFKKEQTRETVSNKSNADYTQHANMHLALFRAVDKAITVDNVTLAGTVGLGVEGSDPSTGTGTTRSGALVCRSVTGVKTSLNRITLEGLTVDGAGDQDDSGFVYAPLLINDLRTKVTLDVQNLSVKPGSYDRSDGKKTVAASSLFGNLGGKDAEMVTAKFSNISLPSLKTDSIFTHASFLESFGYKEGTSGSSGSYIFYKEDSATYGSEIDANDKDKNEYVGDQLWYYNEDTYKTDAGLVTVGGKTANITSPVFGDYLPYVAKGKSGAVYHELKVNQRLANIKTGCGTYADPYALSSEFEIKTVAEYINNESRADDEWEVTITKNQSETCTRRNGSKANTDNEITYKYQKSSSVWISTDGSKATLDNKTMHAYLQSAYYSIEPKNDGDTTVNSITLNTETFKGFGNEANPFRGVVVGNLKNKDGAHTKLVIKGSDTFKGLISHSYGSVVKDLDIEYQDGTDTLTYGGKSNAAVPNAFFGGVIGCIMGGDNIIDGVSVSSDDDFSVAGSGSKPYLVPVGGYVGAICGGGVIFRNMDKSEDWRSDAKDTGNLYDNPYVGRVIDGYAFSEGCKVENGDQNYKINQLTNAGTPCVTTDALHSRETEANTQATVTVHNTQGLLVLSAIINSGAAAGPTWGGDPDYGVFSGVAAYKGSEYKENDKYHFGNAAYGKVRNASYDYVGLPYQSGFNEDFVSAKNDDQQAPGVQKKCAPFEVSAGDSFNSPYLIAKYANAFTGYICGAKTSGIVLKFDDNVQEDKTFDMRKYGSGFLGLSGRYYSNACNSGEPQTDRDRILPAVASIDGNNQTLLFNTKVKQYSDDDYLVQAVGGLFDTVMFIDSTSNGGCLVKNLQIGKAGKDNASTVSLTFKNGDGSSSDYCVGALAGVTANRDSLAAKKYEYQNVKLVNVSVDSPKIAGGLLGASGWASRLNDNKDNERYKDLGIMVDFGDDTSALTKPSPVKLVDCSFNSINVQGKTRVGGFVGAIGSGSDSGVWVTNKNIVVGTNSTLEATGNNCVMGGIVGLAWSQVSVNTKQGDDDTKTYQTAKLSDVVVKNGKDITSDSLTGTGGIVGNPKAGMDISKVEISSSKSSSDESATYLGSETQSSPSNFKRVGGIAGQIDSVGTYTVTDTTIKNVRISANDSAAGIVGSLRSGVQITCDGVTVEGCQINGQWSGSIVGAIGTDDGGVGTGNRSEVTVANSVIRQNNFVKQNTGGIAGDGRGAFHLSNVLLDKNAFMQTSGQGILIGVVGADGPYGEYEKDGAKHSYKNGKKQFRGVYASGIDIIPATVNSDSGQTNAVLPAVIRTEGDSDTATDDVTRYVNKNSYIAFADYNDTLTEVGGISLYNDESDTVASASPYVTTNPVSSISINRKSLFGDGVATYRNDDGKDKILAGKIKDVALGTKSASAGTYTYNNIGGCDNDGNYQNTDGAVSYQTTTDSTFNENNPSGKQAATDFPVLVISGNDTKTVASYLDVITNGGYSDAVRLNDGKTEFVKATVKRIECDTDSGSLVESADTESPSLSVVNNGKNNMFFRASTSWDNNEGRFTLLTVTFNDGAGHKYKVQVPIVVKRMLEIGFTATYSEGSNFNKDDYATSYDKHVLVSGGETMTGYLTWEYNRALDAKGEKIQTEYGWNTHLAGGGAMRPLNKTIDFKGSDGKGTLPDGTQLTLVDTADNNKEYHCTVGQNGVTGTSVKLTDFYRGSGNGKTFYKEKWLSESFDVKAEKSEDGSGQWVQLTQTEVIDKTEAQLEEIAGAKVGSDYYRVRTDSDDSETTFYDLSVDSEGLRSENFYLVVRTPANTPTTAVRVNGYTDTSVSTTVNHHINKLLRKQDDKGKWTDSQQDTASTYSVASNYGHNLVDNKNGITSYELPGTTYSMEMEVSDTISFGNQDYLEEDKLYYQLDSSLVNYSDGSIAGAMGYPAGTGGTYSFYVKVGGNYYEYKSGKWVPQGSTETAVSSGRWDADGGDMSLTLNDSDGNPLDLSGLRTEASAEKQFTIIMKANLTMSEAACINGIVASQDPNKTYTKPSYRAAVSVHADTLKTSSNTEYIQGNASYYRKSSGASTIALEASVKSQLGINVNDLQSADGRIGLVGTYDIHDLMSSSAMVSNATNVTYTLSLQRRNDNGGYDSVNDIDKYITVSNCTQLSGDAIGLSSDKKSYVFSDTKKEGVFSTYIGSDQFNLSFEVKVNTNVETPQQTYANYRLVLTAHMTGGGVDDSPKNSDYVTYTLTKIRTDGLSHSSTSGTTS